jgi:hypothetical protein
VLTNIITHLKVQSGDTVRKTYIIALSTVLTNIITQMLRTLC